MKARMTPTAGTPWQDIREFVEHNRTTREGCICPICGAFNIVKRYRLTPRHFEILQYLNAAGVEIAVHCREFTPDGQAYNKMLNIPRHYGFIRQFSENPNNPLNRSGQWAITARGQEFLNNAILVPACFWSVHDNVIWWATELKAASELSETTSMRFRDMIEDMMHAHGEPQAGAFRAVPNPSYTGN